ncbi:heme lyase CcmF/NrfE family subunit [Shewanella corallii]|uniref:Heme lyase CcmF/NrfE family subunit n=1 Tax=Shewanella corallii TaxID=560080 RepID=A0ABT0N865_9GAMM|nr:heme lyase CcmF/NrfE family subunit [Shewanella corallii]MCL2914628.1 heme lyase CcmF/NrfE family subunit [Shewanella corallii]
MIAEIGHLLLIISTALALLMALVPLYGVMTNNGYLRSYTRVLSSSAALALVTSVLCLAWGFISDDFSISYVANHSNTQLAWFYKIAAVWGSHEGSMLLWVTLIAVWGAIIALQHYQDDPDFIARQQAILGMIIAGFNLFLLFTSNPFARNLPNIPIEGRDLNPVLQDIGLIFHPPLLFLGYVGLTIIFAAAMAALLGSKLEKHQAGWLRHWVLIAWVFLTGGNALGSWWAYNELGWGGWWFWDPVENSSFIPWLVATALLHSVIVTEKRDGLKLTTLLLCLLAFSLSLLGTFLVRSGIVQSVHAFASDPTRGMSILSLLIIFVAGALLLFALKGERFKRALDFELVSKDSFILMGVAILVAAAMSVLLGTFYPLLFELAGLGTISVGAPYFNAIFVPLTFVTVVLMGITPMVQWQKDRSLQLKPLLMLAAITLVGATTLCVLHKEPMNLFLWLGSASAIWLLGCLILSLFACKGQNRKFSRRMLGMYIAHFGAVVSIIGATAISNYEEEAMLRMGPGQGKPLGDYIFVYEATENVESTAFTALQARIAVLDAEENPLGYIFPQRQTFKSNGMQMSQAGIDRGFLRDLYISKGVQLSDTEYLVRISIKPLACWIWLGGALMMIGGLLCALPCRRRVSVTESHPAQQPLLAGESA